LIQTSGFRITCRVPPALRGRKERRGRWVLREKMAVFLTSVVSPLQLKVIKVSVVYQVSQEYLARKETLVHLVHLVPRQRMTRPLVICGGSLDFLETPVRQDPLELRVKKEIRV